VRIGEQIFLPNQEKCLRVAAIHLVAKIYLLGSFCCLDNKQDTIATTKIGRRRLDTAVRGVLNTLNPRNPNADVQFKI